MFVNPFIMNALEVKNFRDEFKLTQTQLAEILGTSVRAVQSWEQGVRNITESAVRLIDVYRKQHNVLPNESKTENLTTHHVSKSAERKLNDQEVYLYDIDAAANLKTLFQNTMDNIIDLIKVPDLPKCDGAVRVKGDSMYPLLKSGDIVFYKQIQDLKNEIFFGEMYLLSMNMAGDEYVVVKYVHRSDVEGCIKLVSYNQHHGPMDVSLETIRAMALVKASLRFNTIK